MRYSSLIKMYLEEVSLKIKLFSILAAFAVIVCLFATIAFNQTSVQAKAPHLTVSITGAAATDYQSGHISVHTLAKAALTISVRYACTNRVATSGSLQGTRHASSKGNYTWTWEPETKCFGGTARATVTAKEYGQTKTASRTFTVH
jgi:hypothetical protein